jgi:ADP-glyceromanno-heptose 6-epimerase precursor (EC 5.1.3.20)
MACDDFSNTKKNYITRNYPSQQRVERAQIDDFLSRHNDIDIIIHLGARTDTAEQNKLIFDELNVAYSQKLWLYCTHHHATFIYASSAATYGNGEQGYDDDMQDISVLKPLNPYGCSKQEFDLWALAQEDSPPHWYGLKFFNVYGPNENHKGRMASVVYHAFHQIKDTGVMRLFKSHKEGIANGCQQRDFIYVNDIVSIIEWLIKNCPQSGLYNAGTGVANTFLDLVHAVFGAMHIEPSIKFIDTPEDIRGSYQYYTRASTEKLRKAGYPFSYTSLQEGIKEYVQQYLMRD